MNRFPLFASSILLVAIQCSTCWSQLIVAHRGASHDAPENTLAAFNLAWQQDSDGVEGDFYLTADNQIVCIHDTDTARTAGQKRIVEESTLSELRELEYGNWKDPKWRGEPIPTFEQVLACVPDGKLFVIELKSKRKIVPFLAAELERLDTSHIRLLVIAFDQDTAATCRQMMPTTPIHWLTAFKASSPSDELHPTASEVASIVKRLGVDGVGMKAQREVIDEAFALELQECGCPEFHVWTVDSIDDAEYFQSLGAIGITTNRPGEVGAAIRVEHPALSID